MAMGAVTGCCFSSVCVRACARLERYLLNQIQMPFKNLWFLLDKHQTSPMIGEEAMINYEDFLKVGEKAGPKCK